MNPLRRALLTGLTATMLSGVCAPASIAQTRQWLVSGQLAGRYSNSVTWVNCSYAGAAGTAHEQVRLNVRVSSPKPIPYAGLGVTLVLRMKAGGSVNIGGSYAPSQTDPDGNVVGCGSQQSFQCSGTIVYNEGSDVLAELLFARRGSRVVGGVASGPFFVESMFLHYPDNHSICSPDPVAITPFTQQPLLGLANTLIEPDVLGENNARPTDLISIPRSKLNGTKPFTVTHGGGPDAGCSSEHVRLYYTQCSEHGRITLTLHFRPA